MLVTIDPVDCDVLANDLERSFAAWYDTNRHKTKALVLVGYSALVCGSEEYTKKNVALQDTDASTAKALDLADARYRRLQTEMDDMRRDYDLEARNMHAIFIEQIRALEQSLADVQKKVVRELVDEKCSAEMLAFQRQAGAEAERYKIMLEQAQRIIEDKGPLLEQVKILEERLEDRERTIALMSKTNAARGNLGEGIVAAALRSAFPDATVVDTSKTKHVGDVHMRLADGRVIVFEVKMKGVVNRADVDKFHSDIKHLKETLDGFAVAVFVSLGSRNIPGKGDLCLQVCNGVPVVFVGFDEFGPADERFMARITNVVLQVQTEYVAIDNRASCAADTINNVVQLLENVRRLRGHADKARASAVANIELADAMRKEIDVLMETLAPLDPGGKKGECVAFECKLCRARFKTNNGLRKHVEAKHTSSTIGLVEVLVHEEQRAEEQCDQQANDLVQSAT